MVITSASKRRFNCFDLFAWICGASGSSGLQILYGSVTLRSGAESLSPLAQGTPARLTQKNTIVCEVGDRIDWRDQSDYFPLAASMK
jgi:hypothetical protein